MYVLPHELPSDFEKLLWRYITVTRSLLNFRYQRASNLQPVYETKIFVSDIFQIHSFSTTLAGLFVLRISELWLVQFVCHDFFKVWYVYVFT